LSCTLLLEEASDRLEKSDRPADRWRCFYKEQQEGQSMQQGSKTAGGKGDDTGGVNPEKEAAYWREQHPKQPYAKSGSYEQFEHAYRTGYSSFLKYPGKKFDEVEESVAADYDTEKPGSALPYDTVRPAISSVWDRMAGVIGPRDPDRGIRGAI
jgi:hypothetical protein